MFTEVNPDKGTETILDDSIISKYPSCLQKLTPIRGRKLDYGIFLIFLVKGLQKLTPIRGRKQSVTMVCACNVISKSLQKLTPIRGRKRENTFNFLYFLNRLQKLTPIRGRFKNIVIAKYLYSS